VANTTHKLSNSLEGALAGGGDPATSPLYVFGPFLKLIVVAGVARITFGASVWLVVLTIALVSAMYRLVMVWIIDGSGGSGLSEEEFGSWAVKINASITFIEYTLTFLVSMAALVTFIADRFPVLNEPFLGIQYRTLVAIGLSILTGWMVNKGPKAAARAFGPATAGVVILLWVMIFATVLKFGLRLPTFNLDAFNGENINFTLGGFARILAVMTGIEIFANLVAAYEGDPAKKSRMAFQSLLIIMGTTSLTMLIVGPAILELADPTNTEVSVFTQTMDQLLPLPLAFFGTLVGVLVLLSASAASAQGLQNLALGLRQRHYIPFVIGERNAYDVAEMPVWIEVAIVSICFLAFGTNEATYLAIYAAGVFILLSMTGWAVMHRLIRLVRASSLARNLFNLVIALLAATFTTFATVIIFAERFREGAWTYFVFLPFLYLLFTYFRKRLGPPIPVEQRRSRLFLTDQRPSEIVRDSPSKNYEIRRILVPINGTAPNVETLRMARIFSVDSQSQMLFVSFHDSPGRQGLFSFRRKIHGINGELDEQEEYWRRLISEQSIDITQANFEKISGEFMDGIVPAAKEYAIDLMIIGKYSLGGLGSGLSRSLPSMILKRAQIPTLIIQTGDRALGQGGKISKVLVALDGSIEAEQILPFVKAFAKMQDNELLFLGVPDELHTAKQQDHLQRYLDLVASQFQSTGIVAKGLVAGHSPAQTILDVANREAVDLIMLATHGRGSLERLLLGSVADRVVKHTNLPVFLAPIQP